MQELKPELLDLLSDIAIDPSAAYGAGLLDSDTDAESETCPAHGHSDGIDTPSSERDAASGIGRTRNSFRRHLSGSRDGGR